MSDFILKKREGLLVVLSGPSGVGKGALFSGLSEALTGIRKCMTYTTRSPRQGEKDGVDYCFVGVDDFKAIIDDDGFLEYAVVHDNYYGSPASAPLDAKESGRDIILEIDVQGGLAVKKKVPEAVMIFVAPPSYAELERRLRGRGKDSEEVIRKRLENARKEMDCIPEYEYLVINDDLELAVDAVRSIIMAERARIRV